MFFNVKRTASTGRYELSILGFKIKFRINSGKNESYNTKLDNLLYELADSRTLQSIKLPKVINVWDSVYNISSSNKSLARFGDGEFKLIMGENISFQEFDPELSQRLKNILQNKNENILVGILDVFGYCNSDYMRRLMCSCRETLYKYINFDKTYVDSNLPRQLIFATHEQGQDYYAKIKSIWENKDTVIVEGAGSRLGVGNDLLDNVKSVKRIICPIKNAFSKYKEILAECLKQDKNSLFIMALGPTATVLAEDLTDNGYRALDIGHLDTAYEAFLRHSDKFIHIEGKIVFNEERHNKLLKPCSDENYNKQIIADLSTCCKN